MVIGRKGMGVAALALVAIVMVWRAFESAPDVVERAVQRLEAGSDVPAVELSRLGRVHQAPPPLRDVFRFGRPSQSDINPVPTPVIILKPLGTPTPFPTPEAPETPTPFPPLNLSLIGIVDNGAGRKAGSFVKDGEIILVGEAGQVLGNAFRVIRIGLEFAEIEELASGRIRRLALRTN